MAAPSNVQWVDGGADFTVTHYTYALESDPQHKDSPKVSASGLNEEYRESFLGWPYGVAMEGTGLAENGKYIKYNKKNSDGSYDYAYGVGGAYRQITKPFEQIAVDKKVIPYGSQVYVEYYDKIMSADDCGSAIQGNHIDVFAGAIPISEANKLGTRTSRVGIVPDGSGNSSGGGSTGGSSGADFDVSSAVSYNRKRGYPTDTWMMIQKVVGTTPDGDPGKNTAKAIYDWQKSNGLEADGKCGPVTLSAIQKAAEENQSSGGGSSSGGPSASDGAQHPDNGGSGGQTSSGGESDTKPSEPSTTTPSAPTIDINVSSAVSYNRGRGYSSETWKKIQETVGTKIDGDPGKMTANAIAAWQSDHGLEVDGKCGPKTYAAISATWNTGSSGSETNTQTTSEPTTSTQTQTQTTSTASDNISIDVDAAVKFNRSRNYSPSTWIEIQNIVGTNPDGDPGKLTANAIAAWQASHGLEVDGKCGSATLGAMGIEIKSDIDGAVPDQALADESVRVTEEMQSTGWCATGVSRAVERVHGFHPYADGNTMGPALLASGMYKQLYNVSLEDALKVPGLIFSWQKTSTQLGAIYGHTAISQGNGLSSTSDYYESNTIASSSGRSGLTIYSLI